ncbi:TPA: DUF2191 domain-containing protein [Candidatus Latescibacteria bacterium]|nr:DUF2191 domain-containing protein [Gemmatimonadota bacterium]HAA73697.1 DUF2191 domain-containing protein [Candidatus Latescibacterota bacterium]
MTILIDDWLIQEAIGQTGLESHSAALEEGLRTIIRLHQQGDMRRWKG